MKCLNCEKKTDNPKFCSKSCSATYNNKLYPKRQPAKPKLPRLCKCGMPLEKNKIICGSCSIKSKESRYSKRREYSIKAVSDRRRKIKIMAIEYLGGKCCICGYNKSPQALDFHHLIRSEKEFNISHNGHSRSWERVRAELDKCVLVCANCHREVEAGITSLNI